MPAEERYRRAEELMELVNMPKEFLDRYPHELSGGQQQRIGVLRALASDPPLILMDEPTSRFQREDVERLFRLVRQLASQGVAVVYISHFLEEVREIADRYTVLRDGRTVDAGVLSATTDEHIVAQMVGRGRGCFLLAHGSGQPVPPAFRKGVRHHLLRRLCRLSQTPAVVSARRAPRPPGFFGRLLIAVDAAQ